MNKLALCALGLAACHPRPSQQASNASSAAMNAPTSEAAPIPPPATGPDAKTPLGEFKLATDPKSAEAAGEIVQHYAALIERHRTKEAAALWADAASASHFTLELKRYRDVHLQIGRRGAPEGAAGSIYIAVPVTVYGRDQNDRAFKRPARIIVRRVNDVPGSTDAQRRWHIERIDWRKN